MSWERAWKPERGTKAQKGGQGQVSKVVNLVDGTYGALKILLTNHHGDSERRRRLAREVRALELLAGRGIPQILDHNMDCVEDSAVPLYFITRWIEGPTLQNYVSGHAQNLDRALKITRDLGEIVMHCHNAGVIHRDIKPDNIIVSNNEIHLVDFGISYLASEEDTLKTEIRQELGNRFLRLPELSAGERKIDKRADITFLVGILYFLLCGKSPNFLYDSQGLAPHRRLNFKVPEETSKDQRWKRVLSILDVGFSLSLPLRFQGASSLIEKIDEAIAYSIEPNESSQYLVELELFDSFRKSQVAEFEAVEKSLIDGLNLWITNIAKLCTKHGFAPAYPQAKISQLGTEAKMLWRVCAANAEEPRIFVHLLASLNGENRSEISFRFQTAESERLDAAEKVFYTGPASDTSRFYEEAERQAPNVFAFAVSLLRKKMERIAHSSKVGP